MRHGHRLTQDEHGYPGGLEHAVTTSFLSIRLVSYSFIVLAGCLGTATWEHT